MEQAQLGGFLAAAELLGIRGLTGEVTPTPPLMATSNRQSLRNPTQTPPFKKLETSLCR